jgi:hypothetical protein
MILIILILYVPLGHERIGILRMDAGGYRLFVAIDKERAAWQKSRREGLMSVADFNSNNKI